MRVSPTPYPSLTACQPLEFKRLSDGIDPLLLIYLIGSPLIMNRCPRSPVPPYQLTFASLVFAACSCLLYSETFDLKFRGVSNCE